jgi:hypothetical protein
MGGKGRPAKRRSQWPIQHEGVEGRQDARNDRAGQRATRQAIVSERVPTPLQDMHLGIGRAHRRREHGRPENVPRGALQSGEHHILRSRYCVVA